jgi:hypothetical protein
MLILPLKTTAHVSFLCNFFRDRSHKLPSHIIYLSLYEMDYPNEQVYTGLVVTFSPLLAFLKLR